MWATWLTLAIAGGPAPPGPGRWHFDIDHSVLGFSVPHLGVSRVEGRFLRFEGYVELDPRDLGRSRVVVVVDVASLSTHHRRRDAHLRSADFFDVERHPRMVFHGRKVVPRPQGWEVHGQLNLRGITKPVVLTVRRMSEPIWHSRTGVWVRGLSARATLDRRDFGLVWNEPLETGGLLVGNEVDLRIEVELTKPPAETAPRARLGPRQKF